VRTELTSRPADPPRQPGLLSADLASSGKQAIVSSLGQGTVVWDLEQGKERWRWRQSDDQEEFVT
jgi:hypothetical protein